MFYDDALQAFLDPDVFGEAILIGPEGLEDRVYGSFDNEHQAVQGGGFVDVSSSLPMVTIYTTDAEDLDVKTGTRVVIREKVYYVRDAQPDGTGLTVLILREG